MRGARKEQDNGWAGAVRRPRIRERSTVHLQDTEGQWLEKKLRSLRIRDFPRGLVPRVKVLDGHKDRGRHVLSAGGDQEEKPAACPSGGDRCQMAVC